MAKVREDAGLIAALKAMPLSELARHVGVRPQSLCKWVRVPAERVAAVEAATGVSREFLRPDLYAPRPKRPRQSAHVE